MSLGLQLLRLRFAWFTFLVTIGDAIYESERVDYDGWFYYNILAVLVEKQIDTMKQMEMYPGYPKA